MFRFAILFYDKSKYLYLNTLVNANGCQHISYRLNTGYFAVRKVDFRLIASACVEFIYENARNL